MHHYHSQVPLSTTPSFEFHVDHVRGVAQLPKGINIYEKLTGGDGRTHCVCSMGKWGVGSHFNLLILIKWQRRGVKCVLFGWRFHLVMGKAAILVGIEFNPLAENVIKKSRLALYTFPCWKLLSCDVKAAVSTDLHLLHL